MNGFYFVLFCLWAYLEKFEIQLMYLIFFFLSEKVSRTLPWTPKVRQKDLDSFLDYTRMKFVGFTLKDDRTTLAGLPNPIHEGVRVLNSHMYRSLAELQIEVRIVHI